MDDAAVVAAGVHAAALAGHPDKLRLAGLLAVQIELGEIVGQHGVVVLLAEDAQHGGAGFFADQRALCHLRKQGGVVPGRGGAQLIVAVKVEGVVQDGVPKAQFPDAGIDGVQPQVIDDHIGGNVVRADDHHGGGVLHLELCPHAQGPEHPGAVHELAGLVGDLLLQVSPAPAGLQIQHRQNERLDGGGRLELLVGTDLHRAAAQVVHKNAHPALIGIELCGNALFQYHILIHLESLNFSILSVILHSYR